ncbi:MAG: type II toxin-antitoxin system VapC family toxin, partial [Candidatus Kapaibacterium sp.]
MITLYFDTCSLQRPLDDQRQKRIARESEAILELLNLWREAKLRLVSSEVLYDEVLRNPIIERRAFGLGILAQADQFIEATGDVRKRARHLVQRGLQPYDALHLASAEHSAVDYLCTRDDKFYRKGSVLVTPPTKVITPVPLIQK